MLNLIYFIRRLSARGGVLLIDEPEQHLHPSLQVALFDTMTEMAERAQVIAVSHSRNLIVSMPLDHFWRYFPQTLKQQINLYD
ncbi:hypothetical protein GCM10010178_62020 [Lentzea flava]|uniref:ATPase AAA-type core domain-containing protein n=2 Tax=Lentzea flava TaxID=103732 RepID=A0ABQ2V0I7_9PSEU|nr:AAA domain-containing protein, putative AbiEii toxin, Type IV TA system [Lentzea flava]GGU61332.1 hypothetical protein GCM10010178_62020 [Lentzea flava]